MSKHSPLPWRIGNAGTAVFQSTGIKLVADLAKCDNCRANGPLIRSSPELLRSLRQALTIISNDDHADEHAEWIAEARAAIAKAEGRS